MERILILVVFYEYDLPFVSKNIDKQSEVIAV